MRTNEAQRLTRAFRALTSGASVDWRPEYVGFDQEKRPTRTFSITVRNADNQPRAQATLKVTARDLSLDQVFEHLAKIEELLKSVDADNSFRDNSIIVKYIWLAEETTPVIDTQLKMMKVAHSYTIQYIDNEEAHL